MTVRALPTQTIVVQTAPTARKRKQGQRRRQRRQTSRQLMGLGTSRDIATHVASMIACGSQIPMRWPDGVYAPATAFQSRAKILMGIPISGGSSVYIQPDDIQRFYMFSAADGSSSITWPTDVNIAAQKNLQVTNFEAEIARYRTTAVRICGKFIGPTSTDGGLIYLKSGMIDPFNADGWNFNTTLPTDVGELTNLDYTVPLREGFEILLQPADPTSRRYRSTQYEAGGDSAADQLQIELGDQWPYLVCCVRGAVTTANILEIEVVVDYEFQLNPGVLAGRMSTPAPPDNPAFRQMVGEAYRKLSQTGQNVASRAAVTALGGMENFVRQALGGVGRALGSAAATGASMLMMSRYSRRPLFDVQQPSLRITEL